MSCKKCIKCGFEKPLEDFGKKKRNADGRSGICKKCEYDRVKQWREKTASMMMNDPDDVRHGTYYGYCIGCRCERCTEENTRYTKERRKH